MKKTRDNKSASQSFKHLSKKKEGFFFQKDEPKENTFFAPNNYTLHKDLSIQNSNSNVIALKPQNNNEKKEFGSGFLRNSLVLDDVLNNFTDISVGDENEGVLKIQVALNYLFNNFENTRKIKEPLSLNSIFDSKTTKALKLFQKANPVNSRIDVLDRLTLLKLDEELIKKQGETLGELAKTASETENILFGTSCTLDSKFWIKTNGVASFTMRPDVQPADAMRAAFAPGGILECRSAIYVYWLKAILDYIKDDAFNEYFKWNSNNDPGLVISTSTNFPFPQRIANLQFFSNPTSVNDLVPGDWIVYENDSRYGNKHPGGPYKHENLIYIGKEKFRGLGMKGELDVPKIEQIMKNEYNNDPTDQEMNHRLFKPELKNSKNSNPVGLQWGLTTRLNVQELELLKTK